MYNVVHEYKNVRNVHACADSMLSLCECLPLVINHILNQLTLKDFKFIALGDGVHKLAVFFGHRSKNDKVILNLIYFFVV